MSGRRYFEKRYKELDWEYEEVDPRSAIRINTINGAEEDIVRRLESRGIELEKIPFLQSGYWIQKSDFSVGATSEYLLGLYSIQEAAAQIPATLFTQLRDVTVLDACAAPGGKTVQLANLMNNDGAIIALDVKRRRLHALSNHLERCRVRNVIVYLLDVRQVSQLRVKFDRILLDVPCSGNFVMDRRWFERRTLNDVKRNAELQREMLREAVRVLRDDGEIVYATCSLEPEENELNIDWAVKTLNLKVEEINCYGERALTTVFGKKLDSSIELCRRVWPGRTQGFFICKLKKREIAG